MAFFKFKFKKPSPQPQTPIPHCCPLGDDYRLLSDQERNGLGGGIDVNICLFHGQKLIRRITDKNGIFLDFPGVKPGDWECDLNGSIRPQVNFTISCKPFREDGLAEFEWLVQPDGRYWMDEDGFGMENDDEIVLYAKLDKKGRFVTPFMSKEDMERKNSEK